MRTIAVLAFAIGMSCGVGAPELHASRTASLCHASRDAAISADGRFVAFASSCGSSPAAGGTDVFVRDKLAVTTEPVSVGGGGAQPNGSSDSPAISADGRFVAFISLASNLVPGDPGCVATAFACTRVFVRDRLLGATERVSPGLQGAAPDGYSEDPSISADGRFIAFSSMATNLVTGDTNEAKDIFVRDRLAGTTERVSVSSDGAQANARYPSTQSTYPAISANGRYVAFMSSASNLVASDTNQTWDVFVRDRLAGTTERVSVSSDGGQADYASDYVAISADGRYVAFRSIASNLVPGKRTYLWDVYVHDRITGTTELVSVGARGEDANFYSLGVSISGDGRYVAFSSLASNLVAGDTNDCPITSAHFSCPDVFVRDRLQGTTERVSVRSDGGQADHESNDAAISADGRYVAFWSDAPNLLSGNSGSVFVRDRVGNMTTPVEGLGLTAPANMIPPSIRRTERGGSFACGPGTWAGSPSTFTFYWLRDGTVITGQERSSYGLTAADLGHRLGCRVTAHNAAGDSTADSNAVLAKALSPRAGRLVLRPWPPRAGRELSATMPVTVGGSFLALARVTCKAWLDGRSVAAFSHSFGHGSARCAWSIPKAAGHKYLRGSVAAAMQNGTARRSFAGKVR